MKYIITLAIVLFTLNIKAQSDTHHNTNQYHISARAATTYAATASTVEEAANMINEKCKEGWTLRQIICQTVATSTSTSNSEQVISDAPGYNGWKPYETHRDRDANGKFLIIFEKK